MDDMDELEERAKQVAARRAAAEEAQRRVEQDQKVAKSAEDRRWERWKGLRANDLARLAAHAAKLLEPLDIAVRVDPGTIDEHPVVLRALHPREQVTLRVSFDGERVSASIHRVRAGSPKRPPKHIATESRAIGEVDFEWVKGAVLCWMDQLE